MLFWTQLGIICIAGGIGGLISSFLTDKCFVMPRFVETIEHAHVWYPGFLGNMLTGLGAGAVSWLLYGPLSQMSISTANLPMTLATIGGAVVVGMSGSGWLSSTAGKNLFQVAASRAASAQSSPEVAQQMLSASPVEALAMAKSIQSGTLQPVA